MVMENDMGGDANNMQCPNHPYKNSTPGGICAFCLQEKLGKLVSSSFPVAVFPASPSSSSSPSFRSDLVNPKSHTHKSSNLQFRPNPVQPSPSITKPRSHFLLTQNKKKKKKDPNITHAAGVGVVFKRSKSTAAAGEYPDEISPRRRGFWSFLYQSKQPTNKKTEKPLREISYGNVSFSPNKVARSRSVGCGSRSFSGEFFDRISTGFGDCTLRRVESHREGKPKVSAVQTGEGLDCIKERVKCGGIFGGFMMNSSNSSSTSSSSYWVSSSSAEETSVNNGGRVVGAGHVRSKSWGWAFASPIRGFGKASSSSSSSSGKRSELSKKTITPNLAAIPSLLSVTS